jgi:hypothetical protein
MKNSVLFFALILLTSSFAIHQTISTAAPEKHPITTKGDTLYYNGESVGAKLAQRHLKEGKYILLRGGRTTPLTECQQSELKDMNLELLDAYGCTAEGHTLRQVSAYNEAVKAFFKAKKGIPDIEATCYQRLYNCNPVGCG